MRRTFSHDVSLEILMPGNSLEIVATVEFTTTPYCPATWDDPAEGGEIEDKTVTALWMNKSPPIASATGAVAFPNPERTQVDMVPWLVEWIEENVSDDELSESVDWGDDREYERE